MSRKKQILTAVGTLGCALGIGFVMQNSEAAEKRYGPDQDMSALPIPQDYVTKNSASNALLTVEAITLTSGELSSDVALPTTDSRITTVSAPRSVLAEPAMPDTAKIKRPGCAITADARPVATAMVELQLDAPCLPNERITVHHNGMIFTETTSATGSLSVQVPALARDAVFVMAFTNGDGAVAQTTVEDLSDFDRVVLQWKGDTGFQIHAREFGADYGTAGHVWSGAPGDMAATVVGTGGMLTRNGDTMAADPLLAEVYTFPKNAAVGSGDVALSVETEISASNCGVEIEAQTLEIDSGGRIKTQNLTLPVPDCDAVGSFLVLNNLLQDLKVAQN